ncbi:MAG: hypothetical protein EZS28_016678 [Streblomastix strix]|uniref:Uncharacterized protein n=1 Tax=Streblomastix strix TaxID=222440 RepID=A0A5J4VYS8_9EUKA|nr:MAG: hypothetical protein EZS28_016678 [Streblomastix strix]
MISRDMLLPSRGGTGISNNIGNPLYLVWGANQEKYQEFMENEFITPRQYTAYKTNRSNGTNITQSAKGMSRTLKEKEMSSERYERKKKILELSINTKEREGFKLFNQPFNQNANVNINMNMNQNQSSAAAQAIAANSGLNLSAGSSKRNINNNNNINNTIQITSPNNFSPKIIPSFDRSSGVAQVERGTNHVSGFG